MVERIREVVSRYVAGKEHILAVFVLGSAVTGNLRPDSDIDLAVMAEQGISIPATEKMRWIGDLSFDLARTVDLGDIISTSLAYSREALLKGMAVYVKDEDRMACIRAAILKIATDNDNISISKAAVIERSIRRILEAYAANPSLDNYTHIDAMILNIERACQAAIDLAQHIVAVQRLGMPENSAAAFLVLENASVISHKTAKAMMGMTGFRKRYS